MGLNTGFAWQPEAQLTRKIRPISGTKLRALGLSRNLSRYVKDLEELRESPPNIVLATAKKELGFIQNYFKQQKLQKKTTYVMGLGVYQQLHTDQKSGTPKLLIPAKSKFKNMYRPYIGQNLDEKSLLVFRTGGIGDLLFIQPNLRHLKEKYPTCKIRFACGPQYQAMVETWDCIDEVLDLPFEIKYLKMSDYHVLFEGVIERCKLAETVNAYNLFSEWLGLSLPDEMLIPKQTVKEDKLKFCIDKLNEWQVTQKKFILLQVRASSPIRSPRPQFWVNIIDELTDRGHDVVLTDNPRQADFVDDFIKGLKNPHRAFNFCRYSLSLDFSIALTKLAQVTLSTDSAMSHIAASLDVPCYGIFGPFPGHIRLKTYPKARWVDAVRHCAPCYLHGTESCPQAGSDGISPCYDNLDINKTVDDIEEFIK